MTTLLTSAMTPAAAAASGSTSTAAGTPTVVVRGKKPYKSWLKDGVNGGPSSMDVLVNWLAVRENYAKWRGGDNNNTERTPKKLLLEEIIDQMRQVGIYHRLPKDVASKISTLQSNYRTAREWNETEGKALRRAGMSEFVIHDEILKRFPYWDALHESFGQFRSSPPPDPMSISSIMDDDNDIKEEDNNNQSNHTHRRRSREEEITPPPPPRRRRLSDSHIMTNNGHMKRFTCAAANGTSRMEEQDALVESTLQEAGRMKRSRDMLNFLREKRVEREQLLIEKERTRRIRAKAELVRNLVDAGFSKEEIAEQLQSL